MFLEPANKGAKVYQSVLNEASVRRYIVSRYVLRISVAMDSIEESLLQAKCEP